MKKVKIAILGCNYMGQMHANCYRLLEDVEVIAVADLNEESAKKVASPFGAKVFTNAEDLINTCALDAIDICLPTFLHAKFVLQAMGKIPYIFVEKPVALTEEECAQLLQKQEETKANVQIGQVVRFWDEYEYLKKLIDEQTYGKVVAASFKRLSPSPLWSSNNWLRNTKLSGGAVQDLHIHDIDYMLYVFGAPKKRSYIKNMVGESNAYVMSICTYDDFVVSVEGTWYLPTSYAFQAYYRVAFERGVVEFDKGVVTVYNDEGEFNPDIEKKEININDVDGGNIFDLGGYLNELKYFTDCIKARKPIGKATLEDGVQALKFVLDEVYERE